MKQEIAAAFAARYPNLKQYQVEKAVNSYVDVMLFEIAESIRKFGITDDQISLGLTDLRNKIGRIDVNGKSQWAMPLLNASPLTSLVLIDFKGQVGKYSRVSLNPRYEAEISDALMDLELDVSSLRKPQEWNIFTPIVLSGLDSFIKKTRTAYVQTRADLEQGKVKDTKQHKAYINALQRNSRDAKLIRKLAFEENGQHLLGQYWEEAESGRYYGHGVNLQRVSKEVRHAALGRCHMYDIKAASYALMTGIAQMIDPTLDTMALIDYVKNRSRIRKTIAEAIGISEEKMKIVFTSLGFGARTANNPYASIRGKLGGKAYNALMANQQFIAVRDGMDRVRKTIADHFPEKFDFVRGSHYSPVCPRTGKKRKADQKLAWIYQAMEADVIARFAAAVQEAGYDPILFVHDCLYFKHRLPEHILCKIIGELKADYPLLEFDHEAIHPIHADDYVDPVHSAAQQDEAEHLKLIMIEEANAGVAAVDFDFVCQEFDDLITALYGAAGGVERSNVLGKGTASLGRSYSVFAGVGIEASIGT